ncbi:MULTISPECIES: tryptophan--tRNA ligase [Asticcacaulis]|uniref:tryptophan--tRNA ligase n=1 Tax=Asticcacaulis TaxID=76890 RepID=UPI001FDA4682|nr:MULTISPECIES: tryptophan--tRNA ligase [Asticcacaulis]MBP2159962.1 tryptophanyl-tRNA synthetase [Asticcacaulis solisilvae]MDR6801007.1 tryptophanyl-tRNA synthetase [Asticcacaulis sp. BE141]
MTKPMRILSGIQASGSLHLGNYLGALKKFADMQSLEAERFYMIADLHAITVWQDPGKLLSQTREIAACYLAAGVDPDKSAIFPQSAVPAHTEMAWLFNCVARLGWLDRMTQFKDKAGKDKERASIGLYTYPVLQAADILIYKATHVPVGEDQRQHLELTRDVAKKFNHDYGTDFFPLPETLYQGPGARIMSLRDGLAKMSKSDPSDNSRINLTDDADTIASKVKKAKSDADVLPEAEDGLAERPEAKNLVGIYAALAGISAQDVLNEFGGKGFGAFKPALADVVVGKMAPISETLRRLLNDTGEIDRVLKLGAERAREVSAPVVEETKRIVGLWG